MPTASWRCTFAEFNAMTPREFLLRLEGYRRRELVAWRRVGTLGAWMLAPWTSRPRSAKELLGWKTDTGDEEE